MRPSPDRLRQAKQRQQAIVALTAWDALWGRLADQAGADLVLVGDSLAMVALGWDTPLPLTLEAMIHHAQAVCRGVERAMVVVDLPFLSYQVSPEEAVRSAGRILKETSAAAVKLEGGGPEMASTIARLVRVGIPVVGHTGLTPQSVRQLGYRQQGRTPVDRARIQAEAEAIAQAGACALVLEHIPADLAAEITTSLAIPTIGIGAGPTCDGQVLVTADLLGLSEQPPPFAKVYDNLGERAIVALKTYAQEVRDRQWPAASVG